MVNWEKRDGIFFSFTTNNEESFWVQEGIRHPTDLSPHLSTWLRSVSSFSISHDCFQVQVCQSSKFQTCVSARIWLSVCVFKHSGTGQNSSLCRFWQPGLAGANWAPAQLQLQKHWIFLNRGNPEMEWDLHVEVHQHTQEWREKAVFLLGQSRQIASPRIIPSSEFSSLIWRLTPPQCSGRDCHKQLCPWASSHTKHTNQPECVLARTLP